MRKFFGILFSVLLCLSVVISIMLSGAVRTMKTTTIDAVVKDNPEYTMEMAERYMDVNQKLEEIFSSSPQMEKILEIIESKGKNIDDIASMLGENVFADIVSKYASGFTDYLADSKTDIYVTEEEVKEALDNSKGAFELMMEDSISDRNWEILSASFEDFATDIVSSLPDYGAVKQEIMENMGGMQETMMVSVVNGSVAWILIGVTVVLALVVILIVRGGFKWTLNIGISLIAGGVISYLTCLIMKLNSGRILSEGILEKFALRAVTTVNIISLIVFIVGLIFVILYIATKEKPTQKL